MDKRKCFVYHLFPPLDEIPKIKICHMVAKECPKVIGRRLRLIAMNFPYSEEASEDDFIYHDGATSDE